MGLARKITRGGGERTAIKELRSSQYPQSGLSSSITFDAVNTTVVGTEVIAIKVDSAYNPHIINSDNAYHNGLRTALPYINTKKGESGFGLNWSKIVPPQSLFVQPVFSQSISTNYKRIPEYYASKITYVFSGYINSLRFPIVTNYADHVIGISYNASVFITNFGYPRQNFKVRGNGCPLGTEGIIQTNFTTSDKSIKGNIANVGISKNELYHDTNNTRSVFNSNNVLPTAGIPNSNGIVVPYSVNTIMRFGGVEPYIRLIYGQTNTNQNANAAWLANQKTQYQRKFNRLKNLGI